MWYQVCRGEYSGDVMSSFWGCHEEHGSTLGFAFDEKSQICSLFLTVEVEQQKFLVSKDTIYDGHCQRHVITLMIFCAVVRLCNSPVGSQIVAEAERLTCRYSHDMWVSSTMGLNATLKIASRINIDLVRPNAEASLEPAFRAKISFTISSYWFVIPMLWKGWNSWKIITGGGNHRSYHLWCPGCR